MLQPRQRHIPLKIDIRQELDRRKRDYEERTGDTGDWGKFLGIVSLAGLTALGIYDMAPAMKRAPNVWQVKCPRCGVIFPVQVPNPPPWRLTQVGCPKCDSELVIDFAKQASGISGGRESRLEGVYTAYCHDCAQPIETPSSKVNPQEVEYLRCAICGRVARGRSWE